MKFTFNRFQLGINRPEHFTNIFFVIFIVIIFIGMVQVLTISPLQGGNTTDDAFKQEVVSTLVHPRILGALFLIIVAAFSVKLLTDKLKSRTLSKVIWIVSDESW